LVDALRPWDLDADALMESGALAALRGDVHAPRLGIEHETLDGLRGRIASVIHAAGSTRFVSNASGEPVRTNVEGTRHVFETARLLGCSDWHFVSTAYVAGSRADAFETPCRVIDGRNAYERSKCQAEIESTQSASLAGATLTIHRPSIVVGRSDTGRATRFTGMYFLLRATSLVARWADQNPAIDRHAIPLQIAADALAGVNAIAIDDLARDFADVLETPAARGGIYHLTHPHPPTNAQVRRVLESYYDIAGGRFEGEEVAGVARSDVQEIFDQLTAPVAEYLFAAPRFDRSNTAKFTSRPPAEWTDARLRRLIEFAESARWRPMSLFSSADASASGVTSYFREFLPAHASNATLGAVRHLNVDVQFRIGDRAEGACWCRFRDGRLILVESGTDRPADVEYRTSATDFWRAVAGETSGAELFLSGRAGMTGDIERALKLAVLLDEFVREFPYRAEVECAGGAP
jgi:nucleoside-diphosphate-sugar epimerase